MGMNRGFEETLAAGYRLQPAKRVPEKTRQLCDRLGEGYHLARLGAWNVAHRVLGDGWSEAVYPTASGRDLYVVELWHYYDGECIARVHGVEFDEIERTLSLLERKYIDGEQFLDTGEE